VDAGIVAMITGTKLGLGTGVAVVGVPWDEGLGLTAAVRVDLEDSGITLEVATIVGGGVELESGGVGGFGYDVLTEPEVAALEASTLESTKKAAVLEAAVPEAAEPEIDGGLEPEIETKVEDITGDGDLVVVIGVGVGVGVVVETVIFWRAKR